MPANEAWRWKSSDTQLEFFADGNKRNDLCLIAIEFNEGQPLPNPTIMADIYSEIIGDWSSRTNFVGIVFRRRDDDGEFFRHDIEFNSLSLELGGYLSHQAASVEGDSGGMLYCYASDPDSLLPVCVVTGEWKGWDHSHMYDVNQVGALRELWKKTTQALEDRDAPSRNAHRTTVLQSALF